MLQLYNTLTREKGPFQPRKDNQVKLFTCGPSIYAPPHIGNYRTFMWEDLLQKYLEYLGYDVDRCMNLTDIEDKAIEEAGERGVAVGDLTEANARRFERESEQLGIRVPKKLLRSSQTVGQAVGMIEKLLEKGYAYRYRGDIFFDPLKFKGFGKLFRLDMSKWPKTKRRFKQDTYPGLRWNLGDFILWHGHKNGDSVCWDTPIGKGRPSWNIQDPAIMASGLGFELDICCGGVDNLYRHHDYNLAVMEAFSDEELAPYWLHGEHVLADGKKMSKSLHNIVYPGDLVSNGYPREQIRFYLLSVHYRKKLNLCVKEIRREGSRLDAARKTIAELLSGIKLPAGEKTAPAPGGLAAELKKSFETAMNDDLDVPAAMDKALCAVERLSSMRNEGESVLAKQGAAVMAVLREIDSVLGVFF